MLLIAVTSQTRRGNLVALNFGTLQLRPKPMIDSDKRDIRTRKNGTFVILSGKRSFSVINKAEIRKMCECVGGAILEAIPNT